MIHIIFFYKEHLKAIPISDLSIQYWYNTQYTILGELFNIKNNHRAIKQYEHWKKSWSCTDYDILVYPTELQDECIVDKLLNTGIEIFKFAKHSKKYYGKEISPAIMKRKDLNLAKMIVPKHCVFVDLKQISEITKNHLLFQVDNPKVFLQTFQEKTILDTFK